MVVAPDNLVGVERVEGEVVDAGRATTQGLVMASDA